MVGEPQTELELDSWGPSLLQKWRTVKMFMMKEIGYFCSCLDICFWLNF